MAVGVGCAVTGWKRGGVLGGERVHGNMRSDRVDAPIIDFEWGVFLENTSLRLLDALF